MTFGASWYKVLMAVGALITAYMMLIGEERLNVVIEREDALNRQYFSAPVVEHANERALAWFKRDFHDTGVMAHSFDMFIPTQAEIDRAEHLDPGFMQPVFGWWERRVRAWWTLVWSSYLRLSMLVTWAPVAVLFVLPWVVDGWTQRERRKHTFDMDSATRQHFSVLALTAIPLVLIVAVTSPLALHPMFIPGMLLGAGILVHTILANFMKRA